MKTDPRIDAYIARQADFAKPILEYLRSAVHVGCPDCEETLKWSMPHFTYRGQILAGMAAFKRHATFGFWQGRLIVAEEKKPGDKMSGMGQFGRITAIDDLPPRAELEKLVAKAVRLVEDGVKAPRVTARKEAFTVPQDLKAAIEANPAAAATFAAFPPSCQREYVEWISEAKRDETRTKRLNQAVEWMAEGKRRHWKYQIC